MPLESVSFFPKADPHFGDESATIARMAPLLAHRLGGQAFGSAVQTIRIVVHYSEMMPPSRFRPRHEPATLQSNGLLEFQITPHVKFARHVGELVELLRMALALERPALLKLRILEFDVGGFLDALDRTLGEIADAPDVWEHIGRMRLLPSISRVSVDQPDRLGVFQDFFRPVDEFPATVMAVLEREVPVARRAAETADAKALNSSLTRLNQAIAPWTLSNDDGRGVFGAFPECTRALKGMGDALRDERNQSLTPAERERAARRLQEALDACRACAERINRLVRP